MKAVPPTPDLPRFTDGHLVRGLVAGLALVILLLVAASVVAVQGTRAIEDDTARVVREQLVMARLLNDAQAGQNLLASVLHQLTRTPNASGQMELLQNLETADAALDRVAQSASATPEAARWEALRQAERVFSGGVREAIRNNSQQSSLNGLFAAHDTVVQLEQELLQASEQRVDATERQIEAESRLLASRSVLLLGACIPLALVCAVLTVVFARKSIRNIEWHANELGRVSWHMLQSQEQTARRFSHELHDELGQSLAAVRANLISASGSDWAPRRQDCIELVDTAIANVRELSQLLHPVILDDFGLDASLRWLTERFAERTGIHVRYASTFLERLPELSETHLFRIAQEAFTNIARHSGASEVIVKLGTSANRVLLSIEDNGRGISLDDQLLSPTLGMTGMRARARHAGGNLHASRPSGGGLRIEVSVPREVPQESHAG